MGNLQEATSLISKTVQGTTLVPEASLAKEHGLRSLLVEAGADVFTGKFRDTGQVSGAGVTFSNFCLADSGTVVLERTDEEIRLATILTDNLAAVEPMAAFHRGNDPKFIAYIKGPSRTADIERPLTIGCHGPRELSIPCGSQVS